MTTSLPSGDGTVPSSPPESGLDRDAAPETGLDPDTATDTADAQDASAAPQPSSAPDEDDRAAAEPAGQGPRSPDRTELDGPALENDEMRRATDDLQSSQAKSAAARKIVDELTAKTDPTGEPE